jgi:5-methylcytosine-specific restriction endonuclease McrBC regulatory subunit McrC
LQNKQTKEHEYIIDAKYKFTADNSNYYQMIAYSIAIPSAKMGMMIFPESEKDLMKCVTVQDPYRNDGREVKILCESIPLRYGDNITFSQYQRNLENQMVRILDKLC